MTALKLGLYLLLLTLLHASLSTAISNHSIQKELDGTWSNEYLVLAIPDMGWASLL